MFGWRWKVGVQSMYCAHELQQPFPLLRMGMAFVRDPIELLPTEAGNTGEEGTVESLMELLHISSP